MEQLLNERPDKDRPGLTPQALKEFLTDLRARRVADILDVDFSKLTDKQCMTVLDVLVGNRKEKNE